LKDDRKTKLKNNSGKGMKKLIFAMCIFLIGISIFVFAETTQIVSSKNEYGGKTLLIVFSPTGEKYKNDAAKVIIYYDGEEKR
jgi:hypothetical protein